MNLKPLQSVKVFVYCIDPVANERRDMDLLRLMSQHSVVLTSLEPMFPKADRFRFDDKFHV